MDSGGDSFWSDTKKYKAIDNSRLKHYFDKEKDKVPVYRL